MPCHARGAVTAVQYSAVPCVRCGVVRICILYARVAVVIATCAYAVICSALQFYSTLVPLIVPSILLLMLKKTQSVEHSNINVRGRGVIVPGGRVVVWS